MDTGNPHSWIFSIHSEWICSLKFCVGQISKQYPIINLHWRRKERRLRKRIGGGKEEEKINIYSSFTYYPLIMSNRVKLISEMFRCTPYLGSRYTNYYIQQKRYKTYYFYQTNLISIKPYSFSFTCSDIKPCGQWQFF